ncbi:hypothetical protein I3760_12G119400 [Carya illinoinensis]|uniref:BHLH domain-containing protein n=1 Tax=Carya illinoinensis TaxID=32201 RepID=A0A8T1NVN1_CARIL|nr:transcription factor ORG2-like [Carya illinoinensis]KAG2677936.1 hypothetical protein I3760_12G119400 [Carya illinoinensis]KAG6634505.1 hypothetical protein CIPAW_12G123000 [Carya illinoinensis]
MLASPPPTPFSTMAWPDLDHQDRKSHKRKSCTINSDINIAASESLVRCPDPSGSTKVGVELNRSTPSTSMSSELTPTITSTVKKLDHNASERDRRKKINTLYSTLRSLLPAADQEKKLSTPATVSRVVKYIPDLQQQVEGLIQKKEALLSRVSSSRPQGEQNNQGNIHRKSTIAGIPSSAVSANWLNDREVMVQISTHKFQKSPLADILFDLDKDGFLLLNASSVVSFKGTAVYNLHLQVDRSYILEREVWNEKFPSLHKKGKEFNNHKCIDCIHFNDL